MERRYCSLCHQEKPYWDFPTNGAHGWPDRGGSRRRYSCRACEKMRHAERHAGGVGGDDIIPQPIVSAVLPLEPFALWLEHKWKVYKTLHGTSACKDVFAEGLGLAGRQLEVYLKREQVSTTVKVVDRVLTREGSTGLDELYPHLYPDLPDSIGLYSEDEVAA